MKKICLFALVTLVLVPNALAAPSAKSVDVRRAVADCESVRPSMNRTVGARTFARAFGAHAFRNCVRAFTVEEHANRHAVVAACKEATDTRRAFAACVADGLRAASREDRRDWVNAAQTCKELRSADSDAFAETYGEGRNAYGKCVASHAKAQEDEAPEV